MRPLVLALLFALCTNAGTAAHLAFTVTLDHPETHLFHVVLRAEGWPGPVQDFKLPVWTPGFYRVLDYAKNVTGFRAQDGQGHALPWEKVTKNAWRVVTPGATPIVLSYDVSGTVSFVAQTYADANRAFLLPSALFMHPAGHLHEPVTISIHPPPTWTRISTGLDPLPGHPNTYMAADYDVLYDSPILLGNQELLTFDLHGVPHRVVIENVPESVNRPPILADLKLMVEAATRLIGDIPYQHYTFLMMGNGNGGIEHRNSAAISFKGDSLTTSQGYNRWLSYVSHEYFHSFNVKRIRPIALGPFDYDQENLTDMLWVSEGLSVYYEDVVLVRAGLMTSREYLDKMGAAIGRFENAPGHRYQSATESSLYTWGTSGIGGDKNTTISYYDNGAMLGAMLDLKIRQESGNRHSLDDVMRALYRKYAQALKRGFTDAEFRQECESSAGTDLTEVFEYASTTKDVDYTKYFAYAGLKTTITSEESSGSYLGVGTHVQDGILTVTSVTRESPAQRPGLEAGDQILELETKPASVKLLSDLLTSKKPGESLKIHFSRNGQAQDIDVTLTANRKRTYRIEPAESRNALQSAILKNWLLSGV